MSKLTITIVEAAPGKITFEMHGKVSEDAMLRAFSSAFRNDQHFKLLLGTAWMNSTEKTDGMDGQFVIIETKN